MDKIAAEAAREIMDNYFHNVVNNREQLKLRLTEIVQSALSEHEKAVRAEYEAIAKRWIVEANMLRWEVGKDKASEILALSPIGGDTK